MCMYMIALALGAGLGNMVGGALQSSNWGLQVGVVCALAGTTSVYGAALSLYMLANRPAENSSTNDTAPVHAELALPT
jgi:hypothetical protein